jgi:hypothetical protein
MEVRCAICTTRFRIADLSVTLFLQPGLKRRTVVLRGIELVRRMALLRRMVLAPHSRTLGVAPNDPGSRRLAPPPPGFIYTASIPPLSEGRSIS